MAVLRADEEEIRKTGFFEQKVEKETFSGVCPNSHQNVISSFHKLGNYLFYYQTFTYQI